MEVTYRGKGIIMLKKSYKGRRVKTVAKKSLRFPVTIATSIVLIGTVVISTILNKGLINVFSDSVTTTPAASSVASESTADLVQTTENEELSNDDTNNQLQAQSLGSSVRGISLQVSENPTDETSASVETTTSNEAGVPSSSSVNSGIVLSNGNTAGVTGSYAAAQMAAATGVSQSTWEAIIARESNGDYTAANASGASGLFQTMPGWGSTATVDDQIQSAIRAYNAQGMSAWGY